MVRRRRGSASTIYIYIYIYILIKFIRGGLECYRLLKDKTILYQDPNRSSYLYYFFLFFFYSFPHLSIASLV